MARRAKTARMCDGATLPLKLSSGSRLTHSRSTSTTSTITTGLRASGKCLSGPKSILVGGERVRLTSVPVDSAIQRQRAVELLRALFPPALAIPSGQRRRKRTAGV